MEIIKQGIIAKASPFLHADYTSATGGEVLDGVKVYAESSGPLNFIEMLIPYILIGGFIIGFIILYNYVIKAKK